MISQTLTDENIYNYKQYMPTNHLLMQDSFQQYMRRRTCVSTHQKSLDISSARSFPLRYAPKTVPGLVLAASPAK